MASSININTDWSSSSANAMHGRRFPLKLYEMIEFAEHAGLSNIISWLCCGRAFKIHDKELLMSVLVPHFFKATKLRSIHRQLYIWGFVR